MRATKAKVSLRYSRPSLPAYRIDRYRWIYWQTGTVLITLRRRASWPGSRCPYLTKGFLSKSVHLSWAMRKRVFVYKRTAKALINLRIRAVWQGLHCSLTLIGYYRMWEWRGRARMIPCACPRWSKSAHFAHVQRHVFALHGRTIVSSLWHLSWACNCLPLICESWSAERW